ncbi:MAG: DUF2721 domain-containing protein [Thermoanaerobaculia bacterium]
MMVALTNPLPANLLAAMVTPAVLISAAGTLVFSTATRLARLVDRARVLAHELEELTDKPDLPFAAERRAEIEHHLTVRARRSHLVQSAVTRFYTALGFFVAATVAVGVVALVPVLDGLPGILGILGSLVLFSGCVQLIRETRLAMTAVDREMSFALGLVKRRNLERRPASGTEAAAEP